MSTHSVRSRQGVSLKVGVIGACHAAELETGEKLCQKGSEREEFKFYMEIIETVWQS